MPRMWLVITLLLLWSRAMVQADHAPPERCRAQQNAVEAAYADQSHGVTPTMSQEAQAAAIHAWKAARQIKIDAAREALRACVATE